MTNWIERLSELVAEHGVVARAVIISAQGPTPRAVGTALVVAGGHVEGRIGRGGLEQAVVARAVGLCAEARPDQPPAWRRQVLEVPTGPVLGEATGGAISVLIESWSVAELAVVSAHGSDALLARPLTAGMAPVVIDGDRFAGGERAWSELAASEVAGLALAVGRLAAAPGLQLTLETIPGVGMLGVGMLGVGMPGVGMPWLVERVGRSLRRFHVYGTGLLGRALVAVLAPLPFDVVWIDSEPARFPDLPVAGSLEAGVVRVAVADPTAHAACAPRGCFHAVMTQAHELDYALCRALLERGEFGYLGVIGSAVKRQRMEARLLRDGITMESMSRLSCPIGLAGIRSKVPEVIAISIAAQALLVAEAGPQAAGSKR